MPPLISSKKTPRLRAPHAKTPSHGSPPSHDAPLPQGPKTPRAKSAKKSTDRLRSKLDRLIASVRRLDQASSQSVDGTASPPLPRDLSLSADGGASPLPGGERPHVHAINFSDPALANSLRSNIRASKPSSDPSEEVVPGVVYLGHIPFGFFEEEMKKFFSQFGKVNRLRLSRSKKTGGSRSYAFIEFEDREIAEIVAETMNDYLMYGRRIKSAVIPAEKVHPNTFFDKKKFLVHDTVTEHRIVHNAPKTSEQLEKNVQRLIRKEEEHKQKLKKMDIDYEFVGYSSIC
ncbi:MKI67 FHA domain-interacting nucleolar phosphoprotein-like [Schistocerca gregaria]|uniref:MKI67 FHA domain-interacting nucleolar phosphoprotein-like n=1 Tax=Schistocerca gregaria TaxID=7010 RepID=UPI00211E9440|nr:MKI67 FHA domain-interacting nucleolar phosphoprotein-like [Schistocerca gregaria]